MPGCPPESPQIAAVVDLMVQVVQGKAELPPRVPSSVPGTPPSAMSASVSVMSNTSHSSRVFKPCRRSIHRLVCWNKDWCAMVRRPAAVAMHVVRRRACLYGCYGAAPDALDQGARLMTAIASVIDDTDPVAIDRVLDGIPDPAGTFYRLVSAHSLLRAGAPVTGRQARQ